MTMLDANIILRYLFDDNEEMAGKAAEYIEDGNAVVSIEVIAEVIYVLKGVYSLERTDISRTITEFLKLVGCSDMNVLSLAVQTFGIEILTLSIAFYLHTTRKEIWKLQPLTKSF